MHAKASLGSELVDAPAVDDEHVSGDEARLG
jgi:hypothetical protein